LRRARWIALAAALGVAAFAAPDPASAKEKPGGTVATDAWTATAPAKPWKPGPALETAGIRSWSAGEAEESQALLRLGYIGVVPGTRTAALADLVRRAKAGIREETADRIQVEQSGFEADSMIQVGPAGLSWHGFRVGISTPRRSGVSWRWVALHPRFPAVRRAFTLAYDESYPREGTSPGRLAAARALAATVTPAGRGLDGTLGDAWLDARAAAFAARIDSAQRLCWSSIPDGAPGRDHVGYAKGIALGGDFYMLSGLVPSDSLVDAAPAEYGVAFDRNGDGRLDLLLVNRGLQAFPARDFEPTVSVYGDDDFDGRIDAIVVEDVDKDGDKRVDARMLARDGDEDGRTDEAFTFDAAASKGGKVEIDPSGRPKVGRVGLTPEVSDLAGMFRAATVRLADLERARTACR
jgi:hypothetical protein